jgi:hypothetical protein
MFDRLESVGLERSAAQGPLDAATIATWITALAGTDRRVDDAERVDQIRVLEELKAAASAAQARASADLDDSVRCRHAEARIPATRHSQGVAAQVALARRESPVRGAQHLGLARVLSNEMPHTLRAMTCGRLNEWRATLLVRETACLTLEDRRTVDLSLAGDIEALEMMSDRQLVAEAKRHAYRLDPESFVRRSRRAEADRTVTCRPAPDTMTYLTGLLPVAQGVAVFAALNRAADSRRVAGDQRSRGQIMADTLVERVTGQEAASDVSVEVQMVMTDRTLLAEHGEPAYLHGYGVVLAAWARELVAKSATSKRGGWLRRLYTAPSTGELIAIDSRARRFPSGLQRLLRTRDQTCRTPWCEAPIRHSDHVVGHDAGGRTSAANGQGLCEGCNHSKQAPGWRARPRAGPRDTVEVTAPTGHRYRSTAPPLPGTSTSRAEIHFRRSLLIA